MSGVLLEQRDNALVLPSGELWTPPPSAAGILLDRIVPRVCMAPATAVDFDAGPPAHPGPRGAFPFSVRVL